MYYQKYIHISERSRSYLWNSIYRGFTFADVSINSNPFSSAYAFASSYSTVLLVPKSDLFPANAITMSGLACRIKHLELQEISHDEFRYGSIGRSLPFSQYNYLPLKLSNPCFSTGKCVSICDIVYNNGCLGTSKIDNSKDFRTETG